MKRFLAVMIVSVLYLQGTLLAQCSLQIAPSTAQTICPGGSILFRILRQQGIEVEGVEWYRNGAYVSSALQYRATTAGSYYFIATCVDGGSTTSSTVQVTVSGPNTTIQTPNGTVLACATGSAVTLSNPATGQTFQWQKNGTNIVGATSSSYSATTTGTYTLVTQSGSCSGSSSVTVTQATLATPTISGPNFYCTGQSIVLSSSAASSYQWLKDGASLGQAGQSVTVNAAGNYQVTVTSGSCTATSAGYTVSTRTPPTASISGTAYVCPGGSTTLTGPSGAGYTYAWTRSGVAFGTTQSITATSAAVYAVTVTSNGCSASTSLTVASKSLPTATVTGPDSFCPGGSALLTAAAFSDQAYQWNKDGTSIPGATASTYTSTSAGNYTVTATYANGGSAGGCTNTSAIKSVAAAPSPSASVSGNLFFCTGGSTTLAAAAGTGYTYQWRKDGAPLSGQSQQALVVNEAGSYSVVVTAGGCSATSSVYTVQARPLPDAVIGGDTYFCKGSSTVLTASPGTDYTYQWIRNDSVLVGQTTQAITANKPGTYKAQVNSNGCTKVSDGFALEERILSIPLAGLTSFCSGDSARISTPATPGATYQWQMDGTDIAGATSAELWVKESGAYTLQMRAASGCQAVSAQRNMTQLPLPHASFTKPSPAEVCSGSTVMLQALTGPGYLYQWHKNGSPIIAATNSSYVVSTSGIYSVVTTLSGCRAVSDTVNIRKKQLPVVPIEGTRYFCDGGSTTMHFTPLTGYTYTWLKNGVAAGSDTALFVDASATLKLIISNGTCIDTTETATLVSELPPPNPITSLQGKTSIFSGQRVMYQVVDLTGADGFVWDIPKEGTLLYADAAHKKVQLWFTSAGVYTVKIYSHKGGCLSPPFTQQITVTGRSLAAAAIPEEVKIGLDRRPAQQQFVPGIELTDVEEGEEVPVFDGCIGGQYYVGFQLNYDFGNRNTTEDWSVFLNIALLHGDDTVWTRPLQVDRVSQTFKTVVFHDTLIDCTGDYRYVVTDRILEGNVPEENVYVQLLLYKHAEANFNPAALLTLNCPQRITANENLVTWNYAGDAAQEFDLEWVFIADYEDTLKHITSGETAFAAKEGVGITIDDAIFYTHQVYYPDGRLWYRARAVSYHPDFPEHRIEGNWYYVVCTENTIDNHQPDKTWQAQTVFAEQGKYKKLMSYYDGTSRQRQALSNLSTNHITVVGEKLYDFEGRDAVNIMGVPINDASLRFHPGLNSFVSTDTIVTKRVSGDLKKFHYDNYRLPNGIISSASGAGRYYSPENDLAGIHRDFIPDAEGYVYSQTEYLNDGTGRISRQSGVGRTFEMDGDHVTRYYYGEAAPAELIRLFGSNVGNAPHYKKNLMVDANGQVNVTYLDQEGRTIATALAGDPPSNVDSLKSFKDLLPLQPVTIELAAKNTRAGNASTLQHRIMNVSPNTLYHFEYDLSAYASEVSVFGCQQCAFDLKITLTDPDGRPVSLSSVTGNESQTADAYERFNLTVVNCLKDSALQALEFDIVLPEIGDYTITKNLTVHELSFEQIQNQLLQQASVQATISQIKNSYVIDPDDCAICSSGQDAEDAINEAIDDIADLDCENIYNQIVQYYQVRYGVEDSLYTVPNDSIVKHELYCKYVLCGKNKDSDKFEKRLSRINTWSDAVAKGYSDLLAIDPFFNQQGLSGVGFKDKMREKLNDVFIATVPYDNNGDGVQDGVADYRGTIEQVIVSENTAFWINENGQHDTSSNGRHLLYLDLMNKRAALGETSYRTQVDQQRWALYKGFYSEAKRKQKMDIPEYKACATAMEELGLNDDLPTQPDSIAAWGEANGVADTVSTPTLAATLVNIRNTCDITFDSADSIAITGHLRNYFNGNRQNFLKLIFVSDLGHNTELNAIQNILDKYSCKLDSVAEVDPLSCARDTIVVIPKNFIASATTVNRLAATSDAYGQQISTKKQQAAQNNEAKRQQLAENLRSSIQSSIVTKLNAVSTTSQASPVLKSAARSGAVSIQVASLPDPEEYAALIAFYNATSDNTDTTGMSWERTDWRNRSGWFQADPNTVQDVSGWYGVTTDVNGHVTRLNLGSNRLSGVIPAEIGGLTYLERFDVSNNALHGSTSGLGTLAQLTYLDMSRNTLDGVLPASFSDLELVTYFDFSENDISGSLDVLNAWGELQYLNARSNALTSLPASAGSLTQLGYMDVADNEIAGPIPEVLTGLTALYWLDLSGNALTGSIPDMSTLGMLDGLNLSDNQLTGEIPASLGSLPLSYLDLSTNRLETIAAGFWGHGTFQGLYLGSNRLVGTIPEGIYETYSSSGSVDNNRFTFTDLAVLKCYTSDNGPIPYAPQDSVDIKKTFTAGGTITLTATVDRQYQPPLTYHWFKYVDGVNDIPLNQAGPSGYTVVLTNTDEDDIGSYYYTIIDEEEQHCGEGLDELILTSRLQNIIADTDTTRRRVTVCLEYDTANTTVKKFTYAIDWNKQIQKCLDDALESDSILTVYAIEKLMDDYVTEYRKNFQTQCLSRATEALRYTYASKEYHYTLYYFDQSGNLEQTVPPEGVRPLTAIEVAAFLNGMKREPAHMLITHYQYSSVDKALKQITSDAGEANFFYDDKFQLRMAQNAQQRLDNRYSYTRYDEQARIVEIGELYADRLTLEELKDSLQYTDFPVSASADYTTKDRTITHYDFQDVRLRDDFTQEYLRSRVAWIEILERDATDTIATHYSYDIHGNVKSLRQRVPGLGSKRIDYRYDLISGKVNYMFYEYGKSQQFSHRYEYDADDRIVDVLTSGDRFIWNEEAHYAYYQHGLLARVELGSQRTQGLDYYYTLQGWVKGVNQPYGDDPTVGNVLDYGAGKDVFAYALGYYQGDYKAIRSGYIVPDVRDHLWERSDEVLSHHGLYNGNISWMTTDLAAVGVANGDRRKGMQSMLYKYDQLHRLTKSRSLTEYEAGIGFKVRANASVPYDETFSYDANGNILSLKRNDALGNLWHNYDYRYYKGSNKLRGVLPIVRDTLYTGAINSNTKLYRDITVKAPAGANTYPVAGEHSELRATENIYVNAQFDAEEGSDFAVYIPDDGPFVYDALGNLIADQEDGVKIDWTPYGKVRQVKTHNDSIVVKFRYDGTGNRIEKRIEKYDTTMITRYVHDASGKVMCTYNDTILVEQPIYGSNRIGLYKGGVNEGTQMLERRSYELCNHLGNVLTVVSDGIGMEDEVTWAEVLNAFDYYPFGLAMVGRDVGNYPQLSDTTEMGGQDGLVIRKWDRVYRYGFNGKEKDDNGEFANTHYDYGFRIYNPLVARFLSVDPLTKSYPWYTPYQFAGNIPTKFIDLDGLEPSENPEQPGTAEKAGMAVVGEIAKEAIENHHYKNDRYVNGQYNLDELVLQGTLWTPFTQESAINPKSQGTVIYLTDTRKTEAEQFNHYVSDGTALHVDESQASQFKDYEAFVVATLMYNFATGSGPENYVFPHNGLISSQFKDSDIVQSALNLYKSGEWGGEPRLFKFSFGDLVKDTWRNSGNIFNVTGMAGSSSISITQMDDQSIKVQVFNVMSLTSGTFGKELFEMENYPKSYVREENTTTPTKFGNISQMYSFSLQPGEY